jgi:hypothetical protein
VFFLVTAVILLFVAGSAFWTWMFSQAVAEADPDERANWVFVVKFFGPIGALMYYFQRYRR